MASPARPPPGQSAAPAETGRSEVSALAAAAARRSVEALHASAMRVRRAGSRKTGSQDRSTSPASRKAPEARQSQPVSAAAERATGSKRSRRRSPSPSAATKAQPVSAAAERATGSKRSRRRSPSPSAATKAATCPDDDDSSPGFLPGILGFGSPKASPPPQELLPSLKFSYLPMPSPPQLLSPLKGQSEVEEGEAQAPSESMQLCASEAGPDQSTEAPSESVQLCLQNAAEVCRQSVPLEPLAAAHQRLREAEARLLEAQEAEQEARRDVAAAKLELEALQPPKKRRRLSGKCPAERLEEPLVQAAAPAEDDVAAAATPSRRRLQEGLRRQPEVRSQDVGTENAECRGDSEAATGDSRPKQQNLQQMQVQEGLQQQPIKPAPQQQEQEQRPRKPEVQQQQQQKRRKQQQKPQQKQQQQRQRNEPKHQQPKQQAKQRRPQPQKQREKENQKVQLNPQQQPTSKAEVVKTVAPTRPHTCQALALAVPAQLEVPRPARRGARGPKAVTSVAGSVLACLRVAAPVPVAVPAAAEASADID
eukprot:TRINITY_DN4846_c0_g1_i5.p1 TRINITY_DN4846_c0_g1~~TRINITY_DN4846_c0_g1_i5.p1  ORF type:complete len:537 (+),score=152.03 TRINITY_DN4846_c0_g1_i5:66-1676(+)